MSSLDKNFLGMDGFIWFFGVVEDRQDPLGLGRVKVRIYGWHSESLTDIPSESLPWAHVVHSNNDRAFATPREADLVIGFFADGRNGQAPIILGIVPGYFTSKPDTGSGFHDLRTKETLKLSPKHPIKRTYNKDGSGIVIEEANTASNTVLESLRHPNSDEFDKESISGVARYENLANTVIKARKTNLDKDVITANGVQWSEPYPAYNPLYPYNQANETESGHIFELDDTPKHERIHLAHRSGSYVEWFPTGTKVEKVTKSNYSIVMADDHLHVMGKVMITIDNDALIKVKGDVILEAGNNLSANVAGSMNFSVGENLNIKSKNLNLDVATDITLVSQSVHLAGQSVDITSADTKIASSGDLNLSAGGAGNFQSGSDMNLLAGGGSKLTGSGVDINGGSSVKIQGSDVAIKKGAASASGASSAAAGTATGLPAAAGKATKTTGEAAAETVPVPLKSVLIDFDPETAVAYKQQQFLVDKGDGTLTTPDAPASNTSNTSNTSSNNSSSACGFDPLTHTFLSDPSSWAISDNGLSFIKRKEGFAKVVKADTVAAYPDPPGSATTFAIGYGTTGPAVDQTITIGTLISRATAEEYLRYAINKKFLPKLRQTISVPLTQNMIDACLSFMYNIGEDGFSGSTMRKRINEKNWCAAADAMLAWKFVDKVPNASLLARRRDERALFLT